MTPRVVCPLCEVVRAAAVEGEPEPLVVDMPARSLGVHYVLHHGRPSTEAPA